MNPRIPCTVKNKQYTFKDNGDELTTSIDNQYDAEGRITATGYGEYLVHYYYDSDGQLVRVDNNYACSDTSVYTYDSRGNVTEKKVYPFTRDETITSEPTETKTFTYANSGWKDRLIKVNNDELTYDANGNVLTYGDREYTWNTGRHLASIIDGDSTYSYTYDEEGIRTSKTVNGVTTYYNTKDGVILSQSDGTNTFYFQYNSSGTPLGFILNGTQYFYITNQMGDVVGITESDGEIICEYTYNEWGEVVDTHFVDSATTQQIAAGNANPLRYRGYYYDSETGYYYLQSRYYDPSICRFINADIPEIAKVSDTSINGANIFTYCDNDPVNGRDFLGYFNWNSLKNKISNFLSKIKNKIYGYFKEQFTVNSSGITMGSTLMAAIFDTIASIVLTAVVTKIFKSTIKSVAKTLVKKFPAKFRNLIHSIFNLIREKKICDFLAKAMFHIITHSAVKKIISKKYSLSNSIKALAKDMVSSMFSLENKLLDNLLYVASSFSSFGGILALVLDLCDFKLDQKLTISYSKIKTLTLC